MSQLRMKTVRNGRKTPFTCSGLQTTQTTEQAVLQTTQATEQAEYRHTQAEFHSLVQDYKQHRQQNKQNTDTHK